jgi:nitrite reductase (NADH) small subunit
MSELVRILSKAQLPADGEAREAACEGRQFCVANVGGEISVMDNLCPHRGGPLAEGIIENGKVICPWHAWAFDVKTGIAEHSPHARVTVYETKIEGEDVLIRMD